MAERRIVVLGGTFDRFHKGHRLLLKFAVCLGKKVLVGVTSDEFASSKNHVVEPFHRRVEKVNKFLEESGCRRFEAFKLDDFMGPSTILENGTLLVTSDNLSRGLAINRLRIASKITPLEILVVPLLDAEDSKPISTTRIIMGEVDENGFTRHC